MINFVKKPFLTLLMAGISIVSVAQQKPLTDDQYFKSNFKGIIQPLPTATRWIDNNNFLLMKEGKLWVIDAKKGTEREALEADKTAPKVTVAVKAFFKNKDLYAKINDAEVQLTNDEAAEVNPTTSPDGNYVAYTKNNDLYTVNLLSKKGNIFTIGTPPKRTVGRLAAKNLFHINPACITVKNGLAAIIG